MYDRGQYGQAINYRKAGCSFAKYLGWRDPKVHEISSPMIKDYNYWLERQGLCRNSISFYNRQLRAMYNKAVSKRYTRERHPFRDVYTGVDKTRKRAVSLREIGKILSLNDEKVQFAKDLFEFSFNTCGMGFADMAWLEKSCVYRDCLSYRRRKTGVIINVPLNSGARTIIKRYEKLTASTPYVFPILGNATGANAYGRYLSALTIYNKTLKAVSEKAGCNTQVSSYVSRHSWATAARNANAPISVISSALGHCSEKTTRVYLDNLDSGKLARLNYKIMQNMHLRP